MKIVKIYFKNMKKEDKEFLQAEVWNRILRMEDLRKKCGISEYCNVSGKYTENDTNFRDVVHAAVEKTIDMLTTRLTPSVGGSLEGTNID